jgi:hypothetical protein
MLLLENRYQVTVLIVIVEARIASTPPDTQGNQAYDDGSNDVPVLDEEPDDESDDVENTQQRKKADNAELLIVGHG